MAILVGTPKSLQAFFFSLIYLVDHEVFRKWQNFYKFGGKIEELPKSKLWRLARL